MTTYITENWALSEAVQKFCQEQGISYSVFSDNWVMRLGEGRDTHFVIGTALGCNNQASAAIATDKVAAYQLLADAGVPAVAHYLVKSTPDIGLNAVALQELLDEHGSLVLKPLKGGRGSHVGKFETTTAIQDFAQANPEDAWTVSPYIDIQRELRLVVLDGAVLLAYEKSEPPVINNLRMYNLNLGATPKDVDLAGLDSALKSIAARSLTALGLRLGAVDIVIDADGNAKVLEINTSFSLEHYAATSQQRRQAVVAMYMSVLKSLIIK
jgi:glutathione synthase/RimK-type ligase-like ATP-grasp enzyme